MDSCCTSVTPSWELAFWKSFIFWKVTSRALTVDLDEWLSLLAPLCRWTWSSSFLPASKLRLRLPWWLSDKESSCQYRRHGFDPWVGKIPWRRAWQPTPVFLPGESHGQRSPVGYSPRGHKESDTTKRLNNNSKTETQGLWLPRLSREAQGSWGGIPGWLFPSTCLHRDKTHPLSSQWPADIFNFSVAFQARLLA